MMYRIALVSAMAAGSLAAVDPSSQPGKPALTNDLGYLEQGNLDNLNPTQSTHTDYQAGSLPADCKYEAGQNNLNPADFAAYTVTYDDCQDPWTICRHKDSPVDLITTIDKFGRLPISIRNWDRHLITVPGTASAYNRGGNIVFFGEAAGDMDVFIHESGHSLDLLGSMDQDGAHLSSSDTFQNAVAADSNVPDNYAGTNYIEDVAQNVVVAVYDRNVPNGFPGVQPNAAAIQNQYHAVENAAGDTLVPGGACDRHLQDSAPESITSSRMMIRAHPGYVPFKGNYSNIITPDHPNFNFSTKEFCKAGQKAHKH